MIGKTISQRITSPSTRPSYPEIRRIYVRARVEEILKDPSFRPAGNWRRAAKDQAHQEFNDFVREEKAAAVAAALFEERERTHFRTITKEAQ